MERETERRVREGVRDRVCLDADDPDWVEVIDGLASWLGLAVSDRDGGGCCEADLVCEALDSRVLLWLSVKICVPVLVNVIVTVGDCEGDKV
jgi:hypothetical protein